MASHEEMIEHLKTLHGPLFAKYEISQAIALLDAVPSHLSYSHTGQELDALWQAILNQFGEDGFGAFQKVLMLQLMADFDSRAASRAYVDEVRRLFVRSFSRIEANIRNPEHQAYDSINDLLMKDLGLCRQKLFPAGTGVVEADSGFHRSLLLRGGMKQFFGFSRMLLQTGGHTGFYEYHIHLSELEDFNPEGYDRFHLTVADMLEVNPEVRGLWGGTWFFDPAMDQVSPHLSYIRETPQANGAWFFFSEESADTGALATSRTRRRLYESGEYIPRAYCMIWPRKAMIRWARNFRKLGAQ